MSTATGRAVRTHDAQAGHGVDRRAAAGSSPAGGDVATALDARLAERAARSASERERALDEARHRSAARARANHTTRLRLRFLALVLVLTATAVLVTVVMFRLLAIVLG